MGALFMCGVPVCVFSVRVVKSVLFGGDSVGLCCLHVLVCGCCVFVCCLSELCLCVYMCVLHDVLCLCACVSCLCGLSLTIYLQGMCLS